jgi:hypothetical protein
MTIDNTNKNNAVNIHHGNKNTKLKNLFETYRDAAFHILPILDNKNIKVKQLSSEIDTDIFDGLFAEIFDEIDIGSPDLVYMLGGGDNRVILNIEFDAADQPDALTRFMLYAANLSLRETVKYGEKFNFPVRTIVIYPAGVKKPTNVFTSTGSLKFFVEQIFLENYIDGDAILAEIEQMFAKDPKLVLSAELVVKFVLAPFGRILGDKKLFCRRVMALAMSLFTGLEQLNDLALVTVSSSSILPKAELADFFKRRADMSVELANLLTDGEFFAARNTAVAEKKRADSLEAALKAEKAKAAAERAKAAAEKAKAAAAIKAEKAKTAAAIKAEKANAAAEKKRADALEAALKAKNSVDKTSGSDD